MPSQRHLRLGNGFVARPALGEHVGRVNHAILLESPFDDDFDGVGECVGRQPAENDRITDVPSVM